MTARKLSKRSMQRARREDGMVMLVVLLVILVGTATAAIAINSTQFELRSAGNFRVATQTKMMAEAAMSTTLSYFDVACESSISCLDLFSKGATPQMFAYAEPEAGNALNTHMMSRHDQSVQQLLAQSNAGAVQVVAPTAAAVLGAAAGSGGSGGSGGAGGGPAAVSDNTGTFGPRSGYVPLDYEADVYDCRVDSQSVPGDSTETKRLLCNITVRGRTSLSAGSALNKPWQLDSAGKTYSQRQYGTAHDATAVLLTKPVN